MTNLQPGQMLGPYRIISQFGLGGMATVYKAYHAGMDRYVAVKVLPSLLAENPEFLGRFQQEARIIANLEHPRILPVHDYGESSGIPYLVMRFLDGGTLKEQMSKRKLTIQEIDRYFTQLTDALEYAHARGVVHRDIKPSNVLMDERGNLFLGDFGIAKLLESSPQFTGTGAMIGTPDYMSPEQAQGVKVDQRTDIYSLGIILYEMVTGRVPFEAETPLAVALKHINAPLPLPSTLQPNLSPAVERVLLKALAKSPDERFQSVSEFHEAWKHALQDSSTILVSPPQETVQNRTMLPQAPTPAVPEPVVIQQRLATTPQTSPPEKSRAALPKLPYRWIVGGAGILLFLCLIFAAIRIVPGIFASRKSQPTNTGLISAVDIPSSPVPISQSTPGNKGKPQWTSWTAENQVWMVKAYRDILVAGGRGLSIRRLSDGGIIKRFVGPPDGLPDVIVSAITFDEQGNLWIGSGNGVGRYDGEKWINFDEDARFDSTSIAALAWTKEGLLVGTQYCGYDGCGLGLLIDGIYKPLPGFPSSEKDLPDKISYSINTMLLAPDGNLWVGTLRGLGRFDGQKWTLYFKKDGLPDNIIYSLYIDKKGVLWVGTTQGAARFNGSGFDLIAGLNNTSVMGIIEDNRGTYWFSCSDSITSFNPDTKQWQRFTQEDGLPSYSYYTITQDTNGNLYFGSDSGIVRYDGSRPLTWDIPNVPAYGEYGKILTFPDNSKLWFVQRYGGSHPDSLDLNTETWSNIGDLPEECYPLAIDTFSTIWCGGKDGLWTINPDGTKFHLTTGQGLPANEISAVAIPVSTKGEAWIGTADKGLAYFVSEKITQVANAGNSGLTSDNIFTLLAASDGSLWVGTDNGVDRLNRNGEWSHFNIGEPFGESLSQVTDITEDIHGAIWVSTAGEGEIVRRFVDGKWEQFTRDEAGVLLPGDTIQVIAAAPDGSVWFGSYYHGAARYNGKNWKLFNIKDGLIFPDVTDIYVSLEGVVWFATSNGVTRYIP